MNQEDTEAALAASRHIRGTMEETRQLIEKLDRLRNHLAVGVDSLFYCVKELQERQEVHAMKLGLLERQIESDAAGGKAFPFPI